MQFEHILLSPVADQQEEAVSAGRIDNAQLRQRSRLRRETAQFVRFNQHYLAIETNGPGSRHSRYELDLAFLDRQPRRLRRVSWGLLSAAGVLAAAAVLLAIYRADGHSLILMLGAGAALLLAALRSRDQLIFYSRHGRVPLVVLFYRRPDAGNFHTFVDDLVYHIELAGNRFPDRNQRLSAELREHRRLMAEGILSAKRYEIVKQRILDSYR